MGRGGRGGRGVSVPIQRGRGGRGAIQRGRGGRGSGSLNLSSTTSRTSDGECIAASSANTSPAAVLLHETSTELASATLHYESNLRHDPLFHGPRCEQCTTPDSPRENMFSAHDVVVTPVDEASELSELGEAILATSTIAPSTLSFAPDEGASSAYTAVDSSDPQTPKTTRERVAAIRQAMESQNRPSGRVFYAAIRQTMESQSHQNGRVSYRTAHPLQPSANHLLPTQLPPAIALAMPAVAPVQPALCLSLMQPFAALVLNGVKTLETRQATVARMLRRIAGQQLYIHIGRQPWPQAKGGLSGWLESASPENQDAAHAFVPSRMGDQRGCVAGLLTVGETRQTHEWASMHGWDWVTQNALVSPHLIAPYATEVKDVRWLRHGLARAPTGSGVYVLSQGDSQTLAELCL